MEETNPQQQTVKQPVQPVLETPGQPVIPLAEPILQPTPLQPSAKFPKKMIIIAGSILLLLLIGAAGFLIASKNTPTAPKTYISKPTMTPTLLKEVTQSMPAVLPTVSHSATQSAIRTNPMDCGKIVINAKTKKTSESIFAQQCFTQAAKVCKPAMLYVDTTTEGITTRITATLEILGKKEMLCELKTTLVSLTPALTTDMPLDEATRKNINNMKRFEGRYLRCLFTTEELIAYLDASLRGDSVTPPTNCTGTLLEIPPNLQ